MTHLSIGTRNLQSGGIDDRNDARLRRQLTLLRSLDLDVLGLQECKWPEGSRLLHLTEHALGMHGFLIESNHHGCHLTLLIRETAGIRVARQRHDRSWPNWHALAHLEVEVGGHPHPLHLVNAHLAPSAPTIRLAEAETFALIAQRNRHVIAVGDWNAAPLTGDDHQPVNVSPPRIRRKLDRRPARAIEEVGFTDVGAYLGDDTPTVGHGDFAYRCDRIYTTLPPEASTGHKVIEEAHPPPTTDRSSPGSTSTRTATSQRRRRHEPRGVATATPQTGDGPPAGRWRERLHSAA